MTIDIKTEDANVSESQGSNQGDNQDENALSNDLTTEDIHGLESTQNVTQEQTIDDTKNINQNTTEIDNQQLNQSASNSFEQVNAQHSAAIFRQFNQGKVITKLTFDEMNAKSADNPLFTCLFNSSQHFELLYQHLGYELCLHSAGDFYYVRELRADSSDEADDNALKVQAILLQLGRYYSQTGRELELLCQAQFGFNENDLITLSKDDESLAILKAIKIDNWPKAIDFITSRNFAYKTGVNSWFISSAGKAFLFNLVEQYSQFEQG